MTPFGVTPLDPLPPIRPGDDLAGLIAAAAARTDIADGDILVVAHKVVSKAEGRLRRLEEIEPGDEARALAADHDKDPRLVQAVLDESSELLRAVGGNLITVTRHGFVCANAGIDQSNVSGEGEGDGVELLLLPEDPDESAAALRRRLHDELGVRPGVLITDSFGRAWRLGQTDVAIGAAGVTPVDQWIGRRDAFGRELRVTSIAVADSIAATADLARAKNSLEPVVVVRGLERFVTREDGPGAAALRRPPQEDLFR